MKALLEMVSVEGASSWLTCRPLHGFTLHKTAFRDGLCLRYGWKPEQLPSLCVYGRTFSVEMHALTCTTGGYTAMRHNEVRDQFASYLRKVAHDVVVEPPLQPLAGERFSLFSPRPRRNLLAWMLLPAVSWVEGSSDHSWTFEFSTRMLPPTQRFPYPPCTSGMRQKSGGGMRHISVMLSMPHWCPLSSLWQWDVAKLLRC